MKEFQIKNDSNLLNNTERNMATAIKMQADFKVPDGILQVTCLEISSFRLPKAVNIADKLCSLQIRKHTLSLADIIGMETRHHSKDFFKSKLELR